MKKIVLAAIVMMTVAGSASAEMTAWDYFWGTALPEWGTTIPGAVQDVLEVVNPPIFEMNLHDIFPHDKVKVSK